MLADGTGNQTIESKLTLNKCLKMSLSFQLVHVSDVCSSFWSVWFESVIDDIKTGGDVMIDSWDWLLIGWDRCGTWIPHLLLCVFQAVISTLSVDCQVDLFCNQTEIRDSDLQWPRQPWATCALQEHPQCIRRENPMCEQVWRVLSETEAEQRVSGSEEPDLFTASH